MLYTYCCTLTQLICYPLYINKSRFIPVTIDQYVYIYIAFSSYVEWSIRVCALCQYIHKYTTITMKTWYVIYSIYQGKDIYDNCPYCTTWIHQLQQIHNQPMLRGKPNITATVIQYIVSVYDLGLHVFMYA